MREEPIRMKIYNRIFRKTGKAQYSPARRMTAVLVVFALIFSSLTFPVYADEGERELICGLTEHVHTAECFPKILACGLEESEPVTEIHWEFSGDFEVHEHTSQCLDGSGKPVCGYAEKIYFHKHNEYCYNENGELICGLKNVSDHKHTDECWKTETVLMKSISTQTPAGRKRRY